jgi:hypothetical protein
MTIQTRIDKAVAEFNNWVISEGYEHNTDDSLPQMIDPKQVEFICLDEIGIKLNIHNHITYLIDNELNF